jgi:methylglutaconyl-CoA hydratase
MKEEYCRASIYLNVGIIELTRPQEKNCLSPLLMSKVVEEIKNLVDKNVKAVMIFGSGTCLSSGADLNWMRQQIHASKIENYIDSELLLNFFLELFYLKIPLYVVSHGKNFGGSLGILACADVVYGQVDSAYCLSEIRLGLVPAVIAPFLEYKIGISAFQYMALTADTINCDEAIRYQLVNKVFQSDRPSSEMVKVIASSLEPLSMQALRKFKEALVQKRESWMNQNNQSTRNRVLISELRSSEDAQMRMTAILGGKK